MKLNAVIFLSTAVVALLPAYAAVDTAEYNHVIHPGKKDGSGFWNERAKFFMYAPAFAFKTVKGAATYRFTVTDTKGGKNVFTADCPTAALSPVWPKVNVADVTVVCEGLDADGKVVGKAGERTFWKAAGFDSGKYPMPDRDLNEAARRVYEYVFNKPATQYLLDTGKLDLKDPINSYASKNGCGLIRAMLTYAKIEPSKRARAIEVAEKAADYLISLSQPAGTPLEYLPPTYAGPGEGNTGTHNADRTMLSEPALAITCFLDLAKAGGKPKYRELAIKMGETYLRLQGEDGTWAMKVFLKDAKPCNPNRLLPGVLVDAFERLAAETGRTEFRAAADRAFASVERTRMKDWNWEAQFEDVPPGAPYSNLTKHFACSTAIYLGKRYPGDRARQAQMRELLRFSEDQFVCWEQPCDGGSMRHFSTWHASESYGTWLCPSVLEQYGCYWPIDASACKLIKTYVALYKAEGKPADLEKAKALAASVLKAQRPNGSIPTWWFAWDGKICRGGNDWQNCMVATADSLVELWEVLESEKRLTISPGGLTPAGALERIRAARRAGDGFLKVVTVRGTNFLDRTLTLTSEDHDIVFAGEDGAALSGGLRLTGWRDIGAGVWEADLPRTAEGRFAYFDQLWVNGRRAPNARLPDEGFFWVTKPTNVAVSNAAGKVEKWIETVALTNGEAKVLADVSPAALESVSEHIVHWWSYARRRVRAVDGKDLRVTTWSPAPTPGWKTWKQKETIVWYENVPTAFDAPGEWLWDGVAGKVRYRPRPGEDVRALSFVAPTQGLSQLVAFEGDYAAGKYVDNVSFRNLGFCHASGTAKPDPQLGQENPAALRRQDVNGPVEMWQLQAACGSDGAVTLKGVRNVRFENCTVEHTGNYAFRFNSGCLSNDVVNCVLRDIGAGGIWMGSRLDCRGNGSELKRKILRPDRPDSTAFNLISNNVITCLGRYNPEGTGVALTHCSDTRVIHNDITDVYYTGVSVGFTWHFDPSVAQRNEIAYNLIADLGKSVMSDMGGVYTLSTSFGTTVHDNIIHDVWSLRYGGWALYCDEGSEGIVLERNLCWNTTDAGFHQHYGTGCLVRNNILAFNRESGAVKTQRRVVNDIPCSVHVVNNIVYVKSGELTGAGVTGVEGVWANNLWWDARGPDKARFGKGDWASWQATGKETGGRLADPLFVDAARYDFRLKPDSPAFALGFKPWDFSQAGRKP